MKTEGFFVRRGMTRLGCDWVVLRTWSRDARVHLSTFTRYTCVISIIMFHFYGKLSFLFFFAPKICVFQLFFVPLRAFLQIDSTFCNQIMHFAKQYNTYD